jgi:hypothetical protein
MFEPMDETSSNGDSSKTGQSKPFLWYALPQLRLGGRRWRRVHRLFLRNEAARHVFAMPMSISDPDRQVWKAPEKAGSLGASQRLSSTRGQAAATGGSHRRHVVSGTAVPPTGYTWMAEYCHWSES